MTKQNTVTTDQIAEIIEKTQFDAQTVYGKTTIVSAKLPNGFVIVESSSCVDPQNYDEKVGIEICKHRIIDKIWELEGYRLQDSIYRESKKTDLREFTLFELIARGFAFVIETNVDRKTTVHIKDERR